MTFADKSRYDKMFRQVKDKGGEYEINLLEGSKMHRLHKCVK